MRLRPSLLVSIAVVATSLALNLGCTASHDCASVYVPDRADLERSVTASFDPSMSLHVELCRNEDCESGNFNVTDGTASNSRLCRSNVSLAVETGCSFHKNQDGSWAFAARWFLETGPIVNGDRYRVTLTSSAGVLLIVDTKATYAESEPNGEGCGVTKTVVL